MPGSSALSRSMSMNQAPPPALPVKSIHLSQQSVNAPANNKAIVKPQQLQQQQQPSPPPPPLQPHLSFPPKPSTNFPPKPASLRAFPTSNLSQQQQPPPIPPPPSLQAMKMGGQGFQPPMTAGMPNFQQPFNPAQQRLFDQVGQDGGLDSD